MQDNPARDIPNSNEKPVTPCLRVCNYDKVREVCVTCNRTKQDLIAWGSMTNEQRLKRMKEIENESLHK
jgi:predicted Fe-S protein YdhL (DUF1289 family)